MKRFATLSLVVSLLVAANAYAAIEGAWTATRSEKRPESIHFQMTYAATSNFGNSMTLSEFTNLTAAQVNAATMTPVHFEMRREAGTIAFEGTFRNGKGAGQFTFAPNRNILSAIRALGVENDLKPHKRDNDEDKTLFWLAMNDVSTAYIKSMQAIGYRTTLDKYLQMRIFDITPEYVREMKALGISDLDADELVESKIHKVTPDYVRSMRAAGYNLTLDEMQQSAIHGMTPAFAAEMKKEGYGNVDFDDLVGFRIHKVTPAFIRELRTLGYDRIDADDLVAMRIHKVTPEFIREVNAAGYKNVPVEKLVQMRIHKITPEFLKKMR